MFIDWTKVPVPRMTPGIRLYVERGVPPGSFLTALLSNNFMEAVGRADDDNAAALRAWAVFIHCELPGGCHGSPEKVAAWIARKGMSDNPLTAVLLDIADASMRRR